jgi:hypothetical protein
MSGIYQLNQATESVTLPNSGNTFIGTSTNSELYSVDSSGIVTIYGTGSGGGGDAFPFTGSAGISGSVLINSQLTLGVGSDDGGTYYNVALGYNNLQNNTTGYNNIALGQRSSKSKHIRSTTTLL